MFGARLPPVPQSDRVDPSEDWRIQDADQEPPTRSGQFWPQVRSTLGPVGLTALGLIFLFALMYQVLVGWLIEFQASRIDDVLWAVSIPALIAASWLSFHAAELAGGEYVDAAGLISQTRDD